MVIVDTSVVFKWSDKGETLREAALIILDNHLKKIEKIIVPDLLFYEAANAWATKSGLTLRGISNNLDDLIDSNLTVENINFGLLQKIIYFSRKYKVSVYDATYAVLAKENKCDLITADNKFVKQVNLPFVKTLDSVN